MRLDSRIKDAVYIADCFTATTYHKHIGKPCYFAQHIEEFCNLENCALDTLKSIDTITSFPFRSAGNTLSRFCLAAEFVEEKPKEKKYRPFTDTKEFFLMRNREVGDLIHIRSKLNNYEYHLLIIGWTDEGLMLGNFSEMTFDELLDKFELWDAAAREWVPFGVEDKE